MNNNQGGDNRDYLDKALEAIEKKIPGKAGARFQGPDASQKNRAMNEKITDAIRKGIEKLTGRKMPSKVSN